MERQQHVRDVPSELEPQFHEEAWQTHLFTRRALQTHRCVKTEGGPNKEKQNCVYLAKHPTRSTHEITDVTNLPTDNEAVRPSRSTHEFSQLSIHHEVLTWCCCCLLLYTVQPSRRHTTFVLQQQLSIHHKVLTSNCCGCCCCQSNPHEVLTKALLHEPYWTRDSRCGPPLAEEAQLAQYKCFPSQRHRRSAHTREANKPNTANLDVHCFHLSCLSSTSGVK